MIELLDSTIRRELLLQRFASYLVKQYIKPTGQEVAREIARTLSGFEDLPRAEQNRIFSRLLRMTRRRWLTMWLDITGELEGQRTDELEYMADLYSEITGQRFKGSGRVPSREMILTSRNVTHAGVWDDYIKQNVDSISTKINGVIKRGAREAVNLREILYQIRGKYNRRTKEFDGGIIAGAVRDGEALARTGVSHYANEARDKFASANRELLRSRVFFATLDSRTTDICLGLHLRQWKIDDDEYPRLPLHYNERSVYLFQVDSDDPALDLLAGAKRPAKYNGGSSVRRVSATLTSDTWLREQNRPYVEEQLGKGKAALFLDGGLSIDKFIDAATYQPLTLEQLRESRDSAIITAIRKAGL